VITAEFNAMPERQRALVFRRFALLRPHVEDGVPLTHAAAAAGVPVRTAQRWLAQYRAVGLPGLARKERADVGQRRFPTELVALTYQLAMERPEMSVAAIHRRVCRMATEREWTAPSYSTVYAMVAGLARDKP
jgi:putative transposase